MSLVVSGDRLRTMSAALLRQSRVRDDVAAHVVASLIETSLRGVDSHGIELLPHYLRAVEAGRINRDPQYRFNDTGAATATLDADHTFGHAAGGEAMRHAMALARESGAACVSVRNSSHFGAAAYFALLAAREGFIALSFTHADSLMRSWSGTRPFFGTNPICLAAPAANEEPFCLDMATTLVSWNKILRFRGRGARLGDGWAADGDANATTDAAAARMLEPIGMYKGYGLAMMVEILCGILSGMPVGRDISRMYADPIEQKRLLGHFFMAIDPARFMDRAVFNTRMQQLMDAVRSEPAKEGERVMAPGDPEKATYATRSVSGIPLSEASSPVFESLAAKAGMSLRE